MDSELRISSDKAGTLPEEVNAATCLPVYFRLAGLAKIDPERGTLRTKRPAAYYLEGLTAVFEPGVAPPSPIRTDEKFSGAEVVLVYPGPSAVEVFGLISRFPEIKRLHIIESNEANIIAIRAELAKDAGRREFEFPALAGYVTDLRNLPAELTGRCDLAVEINVIDPKADKLFRQDAAHQISQALKLGGLFYSAGVTVRWTDRVTPLSLIRVPVPAKFLKRVGYSDALPRPVFYLKHSTEVNALMSDTGHLRKWWKRVQAWTGQRTKDENSLATDIPFVPRVEDGRGPTNAAPWDFLITKPSVRRPAMDWTPKDGDHFGNLTLGSLLQWNRQTGMYVFQLREYPDMVLKLMKPFEGDIPDDPLVWDSLHKSKTLKRENQALKLLKGLRFIPQRLAHGYDAATGWYAIAVEYEKSSSLSHFLDDQRNRLRRQSETTEEVERAVEPVLMLLNSLAIIHEKGLVHQDLKPAHVFLRPASPEAVLIDWGLARKIGEPFSDETRSCSWLHAPPERSDVNVAASAGTHQDLYAVGVMLLQLASDKNFEEQPMFLAQFFSQYGHMPATSELESMIRPHWQWAAPVIARAISSWKAVPGYAYQRYTKAQDMAADILRKHPSLRSSKG